MENERTSHNKVTWIAIGVIIALIIIGIVVVLLTKNTYDVVGLGNTSGLGTPVATSTTDGIPPEWRTYRNTEYKYEFRYPETVSFKKAITLASDDGQKAQVYPAGSTINVKIEDVSGTTGSTDRSRLNVIPLYVEVNAIKKDTSFSSLSTYVSDYSKESLKQGEDSAAGVYASTTPTTINGMNGYLLVTSDGSVQNNRDDKYFFEEGEYIYTFDLAYSGYAYKAKEGDEVTRVDTAKKILTSFKVIK